MTVDVIAATAEWQPAMARMFGLYVYDMSEFMDGVQSWSFPDDAKIEAGQFLDDYWDDDKRWPFIIKVDGELSGFALVNTHGAFPETDYTIAEFFIHRKKRRQGVGDTVARQIFDRLPGRWEVARMPRNAPAIAFWDAVVADYSKGMFSNTEHEYTGANPHTMLVLQFDNR
jgi:predicted acetyltransferase